MLLDCVMGPPRRYESSPLVSVASTESVNLNEAPIHGYY
jgi:hypothetical protein